MILDRMARCTEDLTLDFAPADILLFCFSGEGVSLEVGGGQGRVRRTLF